MLFVSENVITVKRGVTNGGRIRKRQTRRRGALLQVDVPSQASRVQQVVTDQQFQFIRSRFRSDCLACFMKTTTRRL